METAVVSVPLRVRFRGIDQREVMLRRGPAGWAEFSPFLDYDGDELRAWRACTEEAAGEGWPAPVRDRVPVNCIVPAVDADAAERRVAESGCATAKVKVAEPGQGPEADVDRVAAARRALGPLGRVRIDANGAWSVDEAVAALTRLAPYDLEYAEQPCRSTAELAELRVRLARAGLDVPVAADESIRRSGDPERVAALGAADVAVLKVQPLGGVRRCLELAEVLGLPVVVSGALETVVGLRAGLALAAALPRLEHACGLATAGLLADALGPWPVRAGEVSTDALAGGLDEDAVAAWRVDDDRARWWQERWEGAA